MTQQTLYKIFYILMLAYVLYGNQNRPKQSSVFPKLVGSRRRLKTENIKNSISSPVACQQQFYTKQMEQSQFLSRMKKARDIILSHQRRNKVDDQCEQQFDSSILKKNNLKCFSQIVYNINSPPSKSKKLSREHNSGNEIYNDKIMRQCQSQFMNNALNEKQRLNKKHLLQLSNRKKQKDIRNKNIQPKSLFSDKNIYLHKNEATKNEQQNKMYDEYIKTCDRQRTKNHQNIDSAQRLLMKLDFSQQIMDSNGSQLIKRLIKSNNQKKLKQEEERKQQSLNRRKQYCNNMQNQQSSGENDQQINISSLQFPYGTQITRSRAINKVKSKILQKNKKKSRMPFHHNKIDLNRQLQKINEQHSKMIDNSYMMGSKNIRLQNQQQNVQIQRLSQNRSKDMSGNQSQRNRYNRQKQQQKQKQKKQKIVNYNMNKFLYDPKYKIEGWNSKQTIQFQLP